MYFDSKTANGKNYKYFPQTVERTTNSRTAMLLPRDLQSENLVRLSEFQLLLNKGKFTTHGDFSRGYIAKLPGGKTNRKKNTM